LLALKLLVVPAFLAALSFAGKRWGPGVAGWLAGFPLSTGPVLLFLALERGDAFTAQAAMLALAATSSAIVFTIAYAWACTRLGWPGAIACAFTAWFATLPLLDRLPQTLWVFLPLVVLTLVAGPRLFPRPRGALRSGPLPAHELLLRMAAGAAMVLAVTGAAEALGPAWTGYFSCMPVMTSLLTLFSHRTNGPAFTIVLLRSMVSGFCALAAFCTCVALLLEARGIGAAFATAVAAAVLVQGATRALMTRRVAEDRR
jgi:hypothetical protein